MADVVLANLRNVDGGGRFYRAEPADFAAGGQRRTAGFAFLRTSETADGTFFLRASDEAINLLLGALDHDLEYEQKALLLVLALQLENGQFAAAQRTARAGQNRAKQYVERIRSTIEDMRRDVTSVSWFVDVQTLLAECDAHLADQTAQNAAIRSTIETLLNEETSPDARSQLGDLLVTVLDTYQRNLELRRWLRSLLKDGGHPNRHRARLTVKSRLQPHSLPGISEGLLPSGPSQGVRMLRLMPSCQTADHSSCTMPAADQSIVVFFLHPSAIKRARRVVTNAEALDCTRC